MFKQPLRIARTLPNEWEDVDVDAGWTRPTVAHRGGHGPRVPPALCAGLVAAALLLASFAVGLH